MHQSLRSQFVHRRFSSSLHPCISSIDETYALDLLGDGGHDGVVEQGVQQGQQQSADDDSDQDLDAGIHIAFCLDVHDRNSGTGAQGVKLFLDLLKHIEIPRLSLMWWD